MNENRHRTCDDRFRLYVHESWIQTFSYRGITCMWMSAFTDATLFRIDCFSSPREQSLSLYTGLEQYPRKINNFWISEVTEWAM